jgi:hypothetical protein
MFLEKPTESEENEAIEKAARKIANSEWSNLIVMLLRTFRPLFYIGGELGTFFLSPLLIMFEDKGFKLIDTFKKRENIEKLIARIEELENKAESAKKEETENVENR